MTSVCHSPQTETEPRTLRLTRSAPFISVVVPVRNEAAFIRATLRQLLDQNYDPNRFEVIVADGRSSDGTPEIVRALARDHPNLRLIDNPARLASAGRNRAIRVSQGDVIVVVDGHCDLANPNYLRDLADAFERSGADCIGRPQPLDVEEASLLQEAIATARSSWLGHQPASHIWSDREGFVPPQSIAVAYRREIFERVGLFDECFDACEDVELNHRVDRAGLRCFFTPKLAVRYHPRATLAGLFRQMTRYGRGRVRLLRKHRETFSPGVFVPGVFLLGLIVGPLLGHMSAWLLAAYLGTLGLYAGAILMACAGIAIQGGWRLVPWLPLAFVTIHIGAGWGILSQTVAELTRPTEDRSIVLLEPRRRQPVAEDPTAA